MVILAGTARIALWALVVASGCLAYMASTRAASIDSRLIWALPVCLGAHALGLVVVAARRRLGSDGSTRFGADRHGLALLVTLLCVIGLAKVAPHLSTRVIREGIPPLFSALYLVVAGVTPILLARSARRLDVADQVLVAALALGTLSGALILASPGVAFALALTALLFQWAHTQRPFARSGLAVTMGVLVLLLAAAAALGEDRLATQPTATWVGTAAACAFALAARRRDGHAWRLFLAVGIGVASLVALADLALTLQLAERISPSSALSTRLVLFRQHPNFLAPFYAVHMLLAAGLAVSAPRWRKVALVGLVVMAWGVWHTDSKTGLAALGLGAATWPGLLLLRHIARKPSGRRVLTLTAVIGVVLAGSAVTWISTAPEGDPLVSSVGRLTRSWHYRVDAWTNSLKLIAREPVLGVGPGSFETVERFEPGSRFANEPTSPHPHNVLLYVGQSAGLVALLAALMWVVLVGRDLWNRVRAQESPPDDACPPTLAIGLSAAIVALLFANMLDLSMALQTVLPWPLWVVSGLLLSRAARPTADASRELRPAPALLLAFVPFALFWTFGLRPLVAESEVERAELLAFLSSRSSDRAATLQEARGALRHALSLDPTQPRAHEHLARWLEATEDGFTQAREVLQSYIDLAPRRSRGHSLQAHLFMRAGAWNAAADAFGRAAENPQGGDDPNGDRALRIVCLARSAQGDAARAVLAQSLRLDRGVVERIEWKQGNDGLSYLPVAGDGAAPVSLLEALDDLVTDYRAAQDAGSDVGRRFWMDAVLAFREAARFDDGRPLLHARARELLTYLWDNVPEVEHHSIENERALLALAEGDGLTAAAHFVAAYEISGEPYFQRQATEARRQAAPDPAPLDGTPNAAGGTGTESADDMATRATDLADDAPAPSVQPVSLGLLAFEEAHVPAYRTALDVLERQGRFGEAAHMAERLLLFQDDIIERARQWQQIGRLHLLAGDPQRSLSAHRRSLALLSAKPFPLETLRLGHIETIPQTLAADMVAAWRAQGAARAECLTRAWALPDFHSPRQGPSLFRLGLFCETGRPDSLLNEADLLLLRHPHHPLALWMRLFALEALGRHRDVPMALREVIEQFNVASSAQFLFEHLADRMRTQEALQRDPQRWLELGLADLMRGRYVPSSEWFGKGVAHAADDPVMAARLLGWQARAISQSGLDDAWAQAKALLQQAVALDDDAPLLRLRLETIP